jgi:hypothetical protein
MEAMNVKIAYDAEGLLVSQVLKAPLVNHKQKICDVFDKATKEYKTPAIRPLSITSAANKT